LKKILGPDPRVIVRGEISADFASTLNKVGVYVVRDEAAFLHDPLGPTVKNPQLIIVAAEPAAALTVNRMIWGPQQNGDGDLNRIHRSIKRAREGGAVIVENSTGLKTAINAAMTAGSLPVVFFHNAEGEMKFADGSSLTISQFVREYDRHVGMA
jgi:hypothetical protein